MTFPPLRPVRFKTKKRVCTLLVDAEEDFDWDRPVEGTPYSTLCMSNIPDLRRILAAYGAVPTYLLTYPVLEDSAAVAAVRRQLDRGQCEVGLQLHPWVTPPLAGPGGRSASFSGNLDDDLEERKLLALKDRFIGCFGFAPKVYRAGRYGFGANTAALLEEHGFTVDTSMAPRTTFKAEGGPDYTGHDYGLFWFGRHRPLLELPLCRSVVGWGGARSHHLYQHLSGAPLSRLRLPSVLTRSRYAERITLSPEGNDLAAMDRLLSGLHDRGHPIVALSFHSSSLGVGRNPYVRSKADLHDFYDRLSAVLDHLATSVGVEFARAADIPGYLVPDDWTDAGQRAAA